MKNGAYITLALVFIVASCFVYGLTIAIMPLLSDSGYYDLAALYRLLFCWGATYLSFDLEYYKRRSFITMLVKYLLIAVTYFQAIRLIFNTVTNGSISMYEIALLFAGISYIVFRAVKRMKEW